MDTTTNNVVCINDVAFPNAPYHTYLSSVALDSMQPVSMNDVAYPIAPYHTYLFSVAMDSTMYNVVCKYQ